MERNEVTCNCTNPDGTTFTTKVPLGGEPGEGGGINLTVPKLFCLILSSIFGSMALVFLFVALTPFMEWVAENIILATILGIIMFTASILIGAVAYRM